MDLGMARVTKLAFTLQKHWVGTSPEKSCAVPITVAKKTRVVARPKAPADLWTCENLSISLQMLSEQ